MQPLEEIKLAVVICLLKIIQFKALKTLISGLKINVKISFLFFSVTASSTHGAYKRETFEAGRNTT